LGFSGAGGDDALQVRFPNSDRRLGRAAKTLSDPMSAALKK
jgi:hypothetical protein